MINCIPHTGLERVLSGKDRYLVVPGADRDQTLAYNDGTQCWLEQIETASSLGQIDTGHWSRTAARRVGAVPYRVVPGRLLENSSRIVPGVAYTGRSEV